jgi:hypothetical protein
MLFSLEFQPSTALFVLWRCLFIFHISNRAFWFSSHCSQNNQEIRLISHSAGQFYYISQPSSTSLIGMYATAAHILHWVGLFYFLCISPLRPIFCICLRLATGWTFQGSNPGGGEIFRTRPDRPWGQHGLLYNGYRVYFPGVKRPRRGVYHPPPSSARVKERVKLYLYSPSGPWWPVLGRTLPPQALIKMKITASNNGV